MKNITKVISLIFTLVFIYFTVVQYNDPDKSLWIYIYLVAAAVSVSSVLNKYNRAILFAIAISSIFGAFDLFPYGHFEGVALKDGMKTDFIELARESFGFGFIAVASLFYIAMSFKND